MLTRELAQSTVATSATDDPMVAVMRAQGPPVAPAAYAPSAVAIHIPPAGSSEQDNLLEEIGAELSDALDALGLSVADLVE